MRLIFVGDPMCSWCYGFGKQLSEVLASEPDLPLHIVLGGLRAGGTELLDDAGKRFRLTHWARVEAASGLPFNREALMARQGFVYDTEPICRAVVAARMVAPGAPQLEIFRALQRAFYVDGLDTTDSGTLARVTAEALAAAGHPVPAQTVLDTFLSAAAIEAAQEDFRTSRRWGITSFPALLMEAGGELHQVSPGYASADELRAGIQAVRNRVTSPVQAI